MVENKTPKLNSMKKYIFFIAMNILSYNVFSQTFEKKYFGKDYLRYKGSFLKIKPDAVAGFDFAFYENFKYCKEIRSQNVIYPDSQYNFVTLKDSLANKVFIVDNIVDQEGLAIVNTSAYLNPIFMLKDTSTKQIIYYKYDSKFETNFPFNILKLTASKTEVCNKISKEIDDFTGEIKFSSPLSTDLKINSLIIYKYINKSKITYYLSLMTHGSTVNLNETEVKVLFTNGSKWVKNYKINVEADSQGFEYSTFIPLSNLDLKTFETNSIKKFRLYIHDEEVDSNDAEQFKIFVKCIIAKH